MTSPYFYNGTTGEGHWLWSGRKYNDEDFNCLHPVLKVEQVESINNKISKENPDSTHIR
jgi:hypothetical protein